MQEIPFFDMLGLEALFKFPVVALRLLPEKKGKNQGNRRQI